MQFCRLLFMDAISLLFCTSATERHAELKSWLYVALAAAAFVIIGAGAELIALEIAFAIALCLRSKAAIAARSISKSINEGSAICVMERIEGRKIQRRVAGFDHVKTVATRRRSAESHQASFSSLSLPHPGLTNRLLPRPRRRTRQ
jgi:hypothetical protein